MVAVGIVRQSRGRDESLSPAQQRARIEALCEREGLKLSAVHEEIDVSGQSALADRVGLRAAVEAVEAGAAQVVVVAYFDRLFRSLRVQAEVVSRVEAVGGKVLTADMGEVSEATAAQWMSGTMLGVVSEYYARSVRERSGEAQRLAVEQGRPPFGSFPPGLVRGADGRLAADESMPVVAEAFRLRASGAAIMEVRAFLRERGIARSYHGVQSMLRSRLYLGELRFGHHFNPAAHEPVIERALWEAVQSPSRGPRPRSDQLLARLGVLRCASCGARMVVGVQTQNGRRYPFYRCPPVGDCTERVTIGAQIVEAWVIERVHEAAEGLRGRASADAAARVGESKAEAAQAELDAAIRVLRELGDEPAAIERLRELRDARDAARDEAEHLSRLASVELIDTRSAWGRLTLDERRGLIRELIAVVWVAPGRGIERLRCETLVE